MTEEKNNDQQPLMKTLLGGKAENILLGVFGIGLVLFLTNALLLSFDKVEGRFYEIAALIGGLVMIGVLVVLPYFLFRRMNGQ